MSNEPTQKAQLRQEMAQRKRRFSPERRHEASLVCMQQLLSHPRIRQAHTLLLYHAMPDEVDTRPLIRLLAQQMGKTVLLPVTLPQTLELRRYTGDENLQASGKYHIMEPTGPLFTRHEAIDVVVVPGVAFDAQGRRLGHGKGYYDRLLAQLPRAYKIGLCFAFQMVGRVPTTPQDVAMDEVVHD